MFEVLTGDQKGQKFAVRVALSIGRKSGEIVLDDPKVSTKHAFVDQTPAGAYVLIDNHSTNGIRVNEEKVASLPLSQGVEFSIGNTDFRVIDDPLIVDAVFQISISKEIPLQGWNYTFANVLDRIPTAESQPFLLAPLNLPLELSFIQGLTFGQKWVLGYGPRTIGPDSSDLPIYEPNAPSPCFQIAPSPTGSIFSTAYPKQVLLNNIAQTSETLRDGDVISIGSTKILVHVLKAK